MPEVEAIPFEQDAIKIVEDNFKKIDEADKAGLALTNPLNVINKLFQTRLAKKIRANRVFLSTESY